MAKADLHIHSKYSAHPAEWFLRRIGTRESYTEPEFIYRHLKKLGMDFITITDHNNIQGALYLKEKYADEIIIGDEATTYFPENNCKIHILLYGITEKQFEEIQKIRRDIYELREFIKKENIAYSVAHATFSVNGLLSYDHLERLILLFDVFEGINGGRGFIHNQTWMNVFENLREEHIADIYKKHRIEPISDTPWVKGLTGGSDDHAGLFLGQTYTVADGENIHQFLEHIRHKNSKPYGRHNDYKSFVFMVHKVAYDFYRSKSSNFSRSILTKINDLIFYNESLSRKDRLRLKSLSGSEKKDSNTKLKRSIYDLVDTLNREKDNPLEKKIEIAYDKISIISDEFLKLLIQSFEKHLAQGDVFKLIQNFTSAITGILLVLPFFSSIKHMHTNRDLLVKLQKNFNLFPSNRNKIILWFSDTTEDLNGVSVTVNRIRENATIKKRKVYLVGTLMEEKYWKNFINIPTIFSFPLPYYQHIRIYIPSLLRSIEKIISFNPDLIIISTPGPIGLLGLLIARLLGIKTIGIYHTDFAEQIDAISKDASLTAMVRSYTNWFYQEMDEIRVPTDAYIKILEKQGFEREKLKYFERCLDFDMFSPHKDGREWIKKEYQLKDGIYFLYVGRISYDKSLDILLKAFDELSKDNENVYLLLVGDGPHLNIFQNTYVHNNSIIFTGRLDREILPKFYSGSDLFVFPSKTDTFGMVVLEAQACGLPAYVSSEGGPKEIIEDKKTGFILNEVSIPYWKEKMKEFIEIKKFNPAKIEQMKKNAVNISHKISSWETIIDDLSEW